MSKIMELADAYAGANTHARSLTGMTEARAALQAEVEKQMREYRNAALEEATKLDWTEIMREGQLVTWGDAGTLGYRVVEKLRALKEQK